MESIIQQLTDWLKGVLVSGIMDNLTNTFSSVNDQVGQIAVDVGRTPSSFLPAVFNMVRNLSESVIMPVAGILLTFIACYELIQLIISYNNLSNFETWFIWKWIFKTFVAVELITHVELTNRLVCYDIKDLGKQLKKIGMLVVQDQVWGRVTENRSQGKSTRYYMDEMHLLLREEQTAAYTVEIWKRFRKWGGIPTGITQNVKDLLASKEVENIFENSDFIYMLNQAVGDRQILAKQLNISPHQLSYVTHSGEGEGLLFYGNVILPFVDRFPTNTELYRIMTTRLSEVSEEQKKQSA